MKFFLNVRHFLPLVSFILRHLNQSDISMRKPDIIVHLDDDGDDQDLLREAMEQSSSYRLVSFQTSSELFDYLNQHQDFICLIVLDINLPFGDGVQVLEKIRESRVYDHIPVVMLTTGGNSPQVKALQSHNVDVITKPMIFSDLEEIAKNLLAICLRHQQAD